MSPSELALALRSELEFVLVFALESTTVSKQALTSGSVPVQWSALVPAWTPVLA